MNYTCVEFGLNFQPSSYVIVHISDYVIMNSSVNVSVNSSMNSSVIVDRLGYLSMTPKSPIYQF